MSKSVCSGGGIGGVTRGAREPIVIGTAISLVEWRTNGDVGDRGEFGVGGGTVEVGEIGVGVREFSARSGVGLWS